MDHNLTNQNNMKLLTAQPHRKASMNNVKIQENNLVDVFRFENINTV